MSERRTLRSTIAEAWLDRARDLHKNDDVFSAFVAGYIALAAVSAQIWSDSQGERTPGGMEDGHESKKIQYACSEYAANICHSLREPANWQRVQALRERRAPGGGTPIMGAGGDQRLERSLKDLAVIWSGNRADHQSEEKQLDEAHYLAELLRNARNRLFHGQKRFDENGEDADLVALLCPVLFATTAPLVEQLRGH